MKVSRLIKLISNSSETDNIKEGVVTCYGYKFIFKDINLIPKNLARCQSGGVLCVGTTRKVMKDWENDKIKEFDDFLRHKKQNDILLAGSIKTLVPTLDLSGGYEHLFEVWMFVKTPQERRFPATFYYSQSGLNIGGCDPEFTKHFIFDEKRMPEYPKKFKSFVNFSPHDFNTKEKEELAEVLELALQKVPVSDFYGIFQHDFGNLLMGIKDGKPVMIELGFSPKFPMFMNEQLKLGLDWKEFKKWEFH